MATAPKTISGPLGAKFGRDPLMFFTNVIRDQKKAFRRLTARLAARTNVASWETQLGGRTFKSRMIGREDDDATKIATIIALWCLKHPDLVLDEGRRVALDQPPGPMIKSLDEWDGEGDISFLHNSGWRDPQHDAALALIATKGERGEPITAAAVFIACIPLLVAVAAAVLPALMGFVKDKIEETTGSKVGGDRTQTAEKPTSAKLLGVPAVYVAAGGAAALAYALVRK
jgi:hypothetical protein